MEMVESALSEINNQPPVIVPPVQIVKQKVKKNIVELIVNQRKEDSES